jgi:hypothetical protein
MFLDGMSNILGLYNNFLRDVTLSTCRTPTMRSKFNLFMPTRIIFVPGTSMSFMTALKNLIAGVGLQDLRLSDYGMTTEEVLCALIL